MKLDKKAKLKIDKIPEQNRTTALIDTAKKTAQDELITQATSTFNGKLNNYLENVRSEHEQIIDSVNIDTVTKSEWDTTSKDKACAIVKDFNEYLKLHKDEIKALSIFYNQPYNRLEITCKMIKEIHAKLIAEKPLLAPVNVWNAYAAIEHIKGEQPKNELTALVSLIRRACGIDKELKAFDKTIDENFKNWIFKQNAGQHNRFT